MALFFLTPQHEASPADCPGFDSQVFCAACRQDALMDDSSRDCFNNLSVRIVE